MIQDEINQKINEKEEIEKRLEEKKNEFIAEFIPFTQEWYRTELKRTIKDNPDKVLEMGEEKAKELKDRVNELVDNSERIVNEYLGKEFIWWHNDQDRTSYYHYHKIPDKVEKEIRKIFGELGTLLKEFNLVETTASYGTGYRKGSWRIDNASVEHGYGISYPEEIENTNKSYLTLVSECQKINDEIEILEKEKKKENIEEWWDSL